jgi:hypothetical protein
LVNEVTLVQGLSGWWQHQTEDATRMAKTLERERANTPDDIIIETLNNSVIAVEKAQISVKATESSLKALNPEQEFDLIFSLKV